jgi:hypothetical protein
MTAHPLLGRLLWLDDDDPTFCTISEFAADLGGGLLLCTRLDPRTGKSLGVQHVVSLGLLPMHDAEIFANWESLRRAVDGPQDGKVRQLGPELATRNGKRDLND